MVLGRRLVFFFTAYVACTHATCFNPDGSEAKDDKPCYPDKSNSTCCGAGQACLSNNLCGITQFPSNPKTTFGLGEWFVRGSCTDKTFTDKACLNRCLKSATGELYNVFVPVRQCLVGSRDRWYCSNAKTRGQTLDEVCFAPSQTDEYLFQMDGNPSTVTVIGHQTGTTDTAVVATTILSSGTLTVSASPTSSGITSSTPITVPITQSRPDYSIPIGVGVGAPLGVLALGVLLFLYLRHRRQAATKREHIQEKEGPYVQPPIYAYRAELSNWERAGELSTSPDPHELEADRHRVESSSGHGT